MTPAEYLLLANGAISTWEMLQPKIAALVKSGDITPEEQAALMKRIDAIRSGAAFSGEEWQPDPAPPATPSV
jgi:hypothetical protein